MRAIISLVWMVSFGVLTMLLWQRAQTAAASNNPRAPHLQRLTILAAAAAIFGLSSLMLALGFQFTSS